MTSNKNYIAALSSFYFCWAFYNFYDYLYLKFNLAIYLNLVGFGASESQSTKFMGYKISITLFIINETYYNFDLAIFRVVFKSLSVKRANY